MLARHGLASAVRQEDANLEIVVVDDGSTDGTAERLADLGDPRVRVFRFETSQGQAKARNKGISEARGEWIAFLDDDDVWSPYKLRSQLDRAAAADAAFAYTSAAFLSEDGRVKAVERAPNGDEVAALLLRRNVLSVGSSSVMARAEEVRRLGGFDPRLNELSDWDFWIRLASSSKGAACPEVLVGYMLHPQNRRVVEESDVESEFAYLAAKHRPDLKLDRLHFSRWIAMGHLRRGRSLQAARAYLAAGVAHRSPGSIVRAAAALLGERPFGVYRKLRMPPPKPAWLDLYW
jgi:glycosyltransferase involved in cell wall biosynthesis